MLCYRIFSLWTRVATWGCRAVAIDSPGKGKTTDTIDYSLNADFLAALIATLNLEKVVIVSPSMSG
ncbi:protein abhd14b, partial [Plakobranchus ocellatus]